jgi:hypothetical protein
MVLESAAAWAEKAVSQRDQYLLVLLSSLAGPSRSHRPTGTALLG